MVTAKFYVVVVMLGIAALLMAACDSESVSEVKDVADARDAAITYLQEHEAQNAPSAGIEWQEEDVTPPGLVGVGTKEFTSDEWTIKVSYPVVLPENTVYEVVVSSIKLGWHWKGSVEFDGSVTEISAFKQMSKAESQTIAEEFLRSSPTFVFDGIEDTLRLTDTLTARCPYCWVFIFEFESRHAGYGDRTGQALAQVITPHRVAIGVEQGEITSAVMDEKWDMMNQEIIGKQEEGKPEGTLSVSDLLENPVYDTEVELYGKVSLLGGLFCPCFELTSGGQKVQVWYDLMVDNDGRERPAISVEGINNGDRVVVTGELKGEGGTHYSKGDFWATAIVITPPVVSPTEVRVSVQASCDEFYQQPAISKEVEVAVGDSFRVILCSNPTTGFQWSEAQVSDQTVLKQTDHSFVPPGETGIVGAAGQDVWTFKALKEGESTVSTEYSRPWEGGEKAEWTFILTVTAR